MVTPYTLEDHPQLANPQIREVFEALDAGIRSLDPNVSREVLKLSIAYKAETNFVDIVPQAIGCASASTCPSRNWTNQRTAPRMWPELATGGPSLCPRPHPSVTGAAAG